MDGVSQANGADIVGLSVARVDIPRVGIRGTAPRPVVPALPASLAALLLAHRIELEIDVCELFDAQLRGATPPLVDARVLRAYRSGHIPEAIHMPPEAVTRSAVLALPPAPYIVVYGSDALRLEAVRTAHAIADMGFAVKLLSGGFAAWSSQGFPVEQPARSEGRIAAL
jgi:rhodanese-related sulfurtransferase